MKNNKKIYYSLVNNDDNAVINIFGDICSYAFEDFGEVSNVTLSKKLESLGNVKTIDVYINSYGGEVSEGLAIYNALKRHSAKVITHIDGFACSIASVIFMAGDERIMPKTSCLMIHNPWVATQGNSEELRKQADDLDVIGEASINAYMNNINISLEELKELLDKESWISPQDALNMGFATVLEDGLENQNANQSIKSRVIKALLENDECNSKNDDSDKSDDLDDDKDDNSEDTDKSDNPDDDSKNTDKSDSDKDEEEENKDNQDDDNPSSMEKSMEKVALYFKKIEEEFLK